MLNIGTKNIDTKFSMKKGWKKNLSYENSSEYLNNDESRLKS